MEWVKQNVSFCFRTKQGVQCQDVEKSIVYLSTQYVLNIYDFVKSSVLGWEKKMFCRMMYLCQEAPLLVFVQFNVFQTTMTLKAKGPDFISCTTSAPKFLSLVAYLDKTQQNTSVWFLGVEIWNLKKWFDGDDVTLNHRLTCSRNEEKSFLLLTPEISNGFRRMEMIYKSQKMLLEPLNSYMLRRSTTT